MPEQPLLELRGVEVRYGGVPAVRDLSLAVGRSEIVGLIGPNGAGKTSTLHAIMGVVPLAGGDILLSGRSIRGRRPEDIARAGVSLVPEGRHIFAGLTVDENLRLGLAARRGRGGLDGDLQRIHELFPVLREFRRRSAGALSGGQQQQLAIARALMSRPKLLLLDEPTEGIQPSTIKEIERALRELLARGITLVLVEQYVDFALALAQHYAILSRGQIVERGPISELQVAASQKHLAV